MTAGALRLMFYDRTCLGRGNLPGLTHAWGAGGRLYSLLGRFDFWQGVDSWAQALDWLLEISPHQPIAEIQYWGHGQWGGLWIDEELLLIDALGHGHAMYERLTKLKSRLLPDGESLWWFRTCDTFGTPYGHDFARRWTRFFDCRAAGHTYTINFWQSGLHLLESGAEPWWPETEGVVPGWSHAKNSHLAAPNTISCLHGGLPKAAHDPT